ncbi:carbohydrate binding domain-containing protein [Paenarthrobacter sp. Z7-10]|uniref:carbohydrate binding domain-containing protein n=1 Tax=Paenarthrobacter sp. Z7-10 TaxID=2787635 RepID=UPI0022A9D6EA|nr:carbohydrate binding domain-containing protein [Paenarthrobacter sp. Z7-10]MCZ2402938.1 carbohydrate binding domain-containing protein [Paenarthrobacter sp. Z7-10]
MSEIFAIHQTSPTPTVEVRPTPKPRRVAFRRNGVATILALALISVAGNLGTAAFAAEPAPFGPELAANGGFENGTAGWRTNDRAVQELRSVPDGHEGMAVELLTSAPGGVVLNDVENTVLRTTPNVTYAVSAWVKAAGTALSGQLRVRESSSSGVLTHATTFAADTQTWQHVTLDMTTSTTGAKLDLNVLGWDAPSTGGLLVDDVSMKEVPAVRSGDHPAPPVVGSPAPGSCTTSQIGIPSCGVLVGAAVGGNSDPAAFERSIGGTLQIRRTYWGGKNVDKAVATAKADIAQGRLPWISFKLPYSWSEMAAGKGDAWALDLTQKLAQLNGPVWVAFHHEPEGDGNTADWVQMQRRLAPIVHNNSNNVAFTMILTGWHEFHGAPQYSMDNMWPGDGLVDLVGIDPYNWYGTVKNGKTNNNMDNFATAFYPQMRAFASKHHTSWGVAETGYTDAAAHLDPSWLVRSYADMERFGGVAFTYFNTSLNSNGASWPITGDEKLNQFRDILKIAKNGK